MQFTTADIDRLIERALVVECFQIELAQKISDSPIILKGPGNISIQSDGKLKLKLYDPTKFSHSPGMFALGIGLQGIVPETEYYSLVAKDMHGNTWGYPSVYIYNGLTTTPSGSIVEVDIPSMQSLKDLKNHHEGECAEIIILGTHRLPFNMFEDQPDKSSSLVALELSIEGVDIKLIQKLDHLFIEMSSEISSVNEGFVRRFTEGLGVAIGSNTEPAFYRIYSGKKIISHINGKKDGARSAIITPLVEVFYYKTEQLRAFLLCYLTKRTEKHDHLINYWKRLYSISSLMTDVAALALTVNIEGMIKNYFSADRVPSDEVLGYIAESEKIIRSAKLPEYTKSRIQSSLGNMKSLSTPNILKELVSEGLIESNHVVSWSALRNSVAHADNLSNDNLSIERFVNNIHNCISLFYRLIGLSIGYDSNLVVSDEFDSSQQVMLE